MTYKSKSEIRVRIAPSPTGYLHIGTARTALFNWLFAKKHGGKFILRIEDTDLERSDKKFETDIIDSLKWLGLDWDEGPAQDKSGEFPISPPKMGEARSMQLGGNSQFTNDEYIGEYGPYRQSERLEIYEKYVNQLLGKDQAYYCFCSKEELEAQREASLVQGLAPKYSGKCRSLTEKAVKEKLASGESHIIRFKTPEAKVTFKDLIRGEITFDAGLMGDIAIAKDPRVPLYNFAVVVDDEEMKISHVIRGEDHIANTPKQILIQKALSFRQPHYAHLPLILDPDRSKMSKRYSAASIVEYRQQGYLAEAMVNFMALLGWHPQNEKELFSPDELAQEFELERVQKAGAVFNVQKFNWLNSQYIKKLSDAELAKRLNLKSTEGNLKIVALARDRMEKLTDFDALASFFLKLPEYPEDLLVWQSTPKEKILANLNEAQKIISAVSEKEFSKDKLEKILMPIANERGRGEFLWPIRVALSGQKTSPGPFEIMDALGRKETLRRITVAIKSLSH